MTNDVDETEQEATDMIRHYRIVGAGALLVGWLCTVVAAYLLLSWAGVLLAVGGPVFVWGFSMQVNMTKALAEIDGHKKHVDQKIKDIKEGRL